MLTLPSIFGYQEPALLPLEKERWLGLMQVAARQAPAGYSPQAISEARPSWRSRFRALFCCLAPAVNDRYYRDDADASHVRPIQPPTPPPFVGDAVLGPIAGEPAGNTPNTALDNAV